MVRVQSSIKETNHLAPIKLAVLDGPHTSVWIRENGVETLLLFKGNETRWFFASSQTSQWRFSTATSLKMEGNIVLRRLNGGCPNRKWWSQIWDKWIEL